MNRKYLYAYGVAVAAFVLFLLVSLQTYQYQVRNVRNDAKYKTIQPETATPMPNGEGGYRGMTYTFTIDEPTNGRTDLSFFTIHQNAIVRLGDEVLYRFNLSDPTRFTNYVGCEWHYIPLTEADAGRTLTVEITSDRVSKLTAAPDFYLGEKSTIMMAQLKKEALPLILAGINILLGVFFIGFAFYNIKNPETDMRMLYLGIFSVEIAVWKLFDTKASRIIWSGQPVTSYITLVSLMLIPIPFIFFFKRLFRSKEHIMWKVMCWLSFANMGIVLFLQIFGLVDMRTTLPFTHGIVVVEIILCIYMLIREHRLYGWSERLTLNVVLMAVCGVGAGVDLIRYYVTGGKCILVFGLLAFVCYILVFGYISAKDMKKLMSFGTEALRFEKMAYHDELTGLYNRLAWAEMIHREDVNPEEYSVVMLDLNDLKKCNDTMGHEAGDTYIKESATIIGSVFEEVGTAFRMGGDEFCVLVHSVKQSMCEQCLEKLEERVKAYNATKPGFLVQVAYGHARFDKLLDYDLNDTRSRADTRMYHKKFEMKGGKSGR